MSAEPRDRRAVLVGAAFLMATSAIGPGFLTQTAVFTGKLGASFGFAILASVILDIGAQINIWRVIAVAEQRAQDIANRVAPGLGTLLAVLVVLGGLIFNIGNVAGCALGLQALFGVPLVAGAVVSAGVAIGLFLLRDAGRAMDRFAQFLGFVMIGLTLYVAVTSRPPLAEALVRSVAPIQLDWIAVVTLVGGTVGGYITFAGGHRLLDAGISGRGALREVSRSAVMGIVVTSIMRVGLFLAVLGVVSAGAALDPANPPASVFQHAAGQVGLRLFGLVMWCAAVTSVVGASYTSVSFLRTLSARVETRQRATIITFVLISTAVFLIVGRPVQLLVAAGAANGLILPLALGAMLMAARRRDIVGDYRHPLWMIVFGWAVALAMTAMAAYTIAITLPALS
ncbi:MAG TPA: NRAMP family divalent metal transporter [Longimicrobium sp.]|nr:NRAMP family divalent metal transporter [Longimicrobium sp.]